MPLSALDAGFHHGVLIEVELLLNYLKLVLKVYNCTS